LMHRIHPCDSMLRIGSGGRKRRKEGGGPEKTIVIAWKAEDGERNSLGIPMKIKLQ